LKKRLEVGTAQITSIKKEFSETVQGAKQANMNSNYNPQISLFLSVPSLSALHSFLHHY
jgi:hypothetical protein